MRSVWASENGQRLIAAACAVAVLWLMARLLLIVPKPPPPTASVTTQVRLIQRTPPREPSALPLPPPGTPRPAAAVEAERPAAVAREAQATPPARQPQAPPPPSLAQDLYTRQGRVRVRDNQVTVAPARPPGAGAAPVSDDAKRILEPDNPIDYEATRFDKDWASDGTLGQRAGKAIERATAKLGKAIFGEDIQHATARPPPDVAINPALHERASDLGSEATGDAYKAAPVAHEKVPDLQGEASRRIRAARDALRPRLAVACSAQRRDALLAPVAKHLKDLEQAEYGLAHGADPALAANVLPQQADSAYNLARQALWYAEHKLADCGG